jgi:hypothetical protein
MGITNIPLKTAEEHLKLWLAAELAIATGQSYRIGTQLLQRADLGAVKRQIEYWDNQITKIKSRGGKVRISRGIITDR